MKAQSDKTIPILIISYGLFLIFIVLVSLNFKWTTLSIVSTSFGTWIILLGLWKIESFEIKENKLTKTNFLGVFRQTINLGSIVRYDKKVIDTDHFNNPFKIIDFFSNNKKYLTFRKITIITDKNIKMKLDERTITTESFNIVYNKIKAAKKDV